MPTAYLFTVSGQSRYTSHSFYLLPSEWNPSGNGIVMLTYNVYSAADVDTAGLTASLINQRDFLSNIQVYNAAGGVEQNVQLYSASGTNYNTAITPEPDPLLLLGSAALLLLVLRPRVTHPV